ncbi:MAG: helix-turn-helix transcriptional regulator [Pseudomonadota bacterium]
MGERNPARLSNEANQRAALQVREALARRRMSRQQLAADAMISISTLEKALSGKRPFTMATLVRLEDALRLPLREETPSTEGPTPISLETVNGLAPETLGSYSRPAVSWLEGRYLTLRPSFGTGQAIYAYCTQIAWDDDNSQLEFSETDRTDKAFSQYGLVSIPHQSGHIYLVTNRHGQYRLIILSRPTIHGEMHGTLSTLRAGRGAHLAPVATPIALLPFDKGSAITEKPEFGRVEPGSERYADYADVLQRTTGEGYASIVT